MKPVTLSTPFLDQGIRSVNFFNGRLLTAEDMKKEQQAEALYRQRLGRVLGEGISHGLRVSIKPAGAKPKTMVVEPGTAINAMGQVIKLAEQVEIALPTSAPTNGSQAAPAMLNDCEPPEAGVYLAGTGLYLLSIRPGKGLEGSVQVSGLGNTLLGSKTPCCGARHQVEGPTFRLTDLTPRFSATELANATKLRSTLARRCFGVSNALSWITDPLAATDPPVDRPLERLGVADSDALKGCVPLAVLYWTTSGGLEFADNWCVRRRPSGQPAEKGWPLQTGQGRAAEAEAMLWQFQDHVTAIQSPATVRATDVFTYLPPAGILAVDSTAKLSGFPGFKMTKFFEGFALRDPIYMEGAQVEHLLREALAFPPMDLMVDGSRMVWVYHIRENGMSADGLTPGNARPYVIFTTGQVPYAADARFDVARWDYASFA